MADAWTPLGEDEYVRVWRQFDDLFRFTPGMDPALWPAIREPDGAITVDLRPIFADEGANFAAGEAAVNALVLRALVAITGPDERLLALDWQHPAYHFTPHDHALTDDDWTVPPFPNGDYYAFLSLDMTTGTFGHPWEQSLCVFGERLVAALLPSLSAWLPVRRGSLAS